MYMPIYWLYENMYDIFVCYIAIVMNIEDTCIIQKISSGMVNKLIKEVKHGQENSICEITVVVFILHWNSHNIAVYKSVAIETQIQNNKNKVSCIIDFVLTVVEYQRDFLFHVLFCYFFYVDIIDSKLTSYVVKWGVQEAKDV